MAGETILVIDDSAELRSVLETILPYAGYEVFLASSGAEGLRLVQQKQPDLIMIDLELPDTNGLKILEMLNEQGLSIPTIMMTGYGSEGVAARALRLGVRDYLIKPFTTEEVLSSVERALVESRLRREQARLKAALASHARHLKLIATVGRSLTAGPDPGEAWQRIAGSAAYVTHAETALLFLLGKKGTVLHLVGAEGQTQPVPTTVPPTAGDRRLQAVLERGTPVMLNSTDDSPIVLQTGETVRSVLQVPLLHRGHAVGILSVARRHKGTAFTEYDQQLLTILAGYAILILEQQRSGRSPGKP